MRTLALLCALGALPAQAQALGSPAPLLPSERFDARLLELDGEITSARLTLSHAKRLKGLGVTAGVLSGVSLASAAVCTAFVPGAQLAGAAGSLVGGRAGASWSSAADQLRASATGLLVTSGLLALTAVIGGLAGLHLDEGVHAALLDAELRRAQLVGQQATAARLRFRAAEAATPPVPAPELQPLDISPPRRPLRPADAPTVE